MAFDNISVSDMNYLPCIEVEPDDYATTGIHLQADAAVIWLHGLGASGDDFEPIVPELHLPADMAIRFIFPHAPTIPVTINGGMLMPAWYDILALDIEREINKQQFQASVDAVIALIDREIERGVASERIILAGFSQGGAIAYEVALGYTRPLAGLMTMSTYFGSNKTIKPHPANKNIPIHIFHGLYDPMVPETMGKQAVTALEDLGYSPEYRTYPMEHQVCLEQINDIAAWLQKVLGKS